MPMAICKRSIGSVLTWVGRSSPPRSPTGRGAWVGNPLHERGSVAWAGLFLFIIVNGAALRPWVRDYNRSFSSRS
ncbi:hypothetical protein BU26DRAFT_140772 [Trematosphaeria pertusa]|uniref:Uncharacterized protein n=1 Tax=Trematosphaeria pertusa TaxID=390896 RepID=A0A6A6IWA7_9PLEO|nr:uncharacterized protein BU26DRAFT_140772 [Trematosphaeria pertusa]KAF2254568.1 hypothetical protein BU26DRAFT_140772 [Trematosphaeria pertusa]